MKLNAMTFTEHRADIALDDTVRIDGESFTWVVDAIVPGNTYARTTDVVRVSRTYRTAHGLRTTQISVAAAKLGSMRLARKSNDDQQALDEDAERFGYPVSPVPVSTHVVRGGKIVKL